MLPMLLQEGGQGPCHLENLFQHMETVLVLVPIAPTISRIHHCIHFEPIHRLPSGGIFLRTYSV